MTKLTVHYVQISTLIDNPLNARTHSDKQVSQLAKSIKKFGFNTPVLIDAKCKLIAGHGRVMAARELGIEEVPAIRLEHLNDTQRRAYMIADNRIAELAGWDKEILASEFSELLDMELEFEITDLGFEMAEIDLLIGDTVSPDTNEEPGDIGIPESLSPVCRPGDLWQAGRHLVFCGDALDAKSYEVLMSGCWAAMVFTDPPYNVPINGHVSGLGRASHREFTQASGEMTQQEFRQFLKQTSLLMQQWSGDGSLHFVCMDWRHIHDLVEAGSSVYSELKNICVWVKTNAGMGSLYRSKHEMVAIFKSGTAKHTNNVELGRHGRYRTNVWEYCGMNCFQSNRDAKLEMHPTVKPTAMVADAILDCTARGGVVLDPFGGSGTTLLAAERTGRVARLIEIDPGYVDVTLSRYLSMTGQAPINLWTGAPFGVPAPTPSILAAGEA